MKENFYVNKLNLSGTEKESLYSLESLNLEDWKDFLRDLAFSPEKIAPLFNIRLDDDPQIYSEILFESLGREPRCLLIKALEELFIESFHLSKIDEEHQDAMYSYFSITESLGEGIKSKDLKKIMFDENYPQDFRETASEILLSLNSPPPLEFWTEIDFNQHPFFTVSAMTALAEKTPVESLSLLSRIPNELLSDMESLEYPVEIALENLQTKVTQKELNEISLLIKGLPLPVREFVEELPLYKEIFKKDNSSWINFIVEDAKRFGQFFYFYTGYQVKQLFKPTLHPEPFEYDFLDAIKSEIIKYIDDNTTAIDPHKLQINNLKDMMDKILEGQVLIPEVGYGTPLRGERAMMIKIGEIKQTAVLIPSKLTDIYRSYFGIKKGSARIELKRIFRFCLEHGVGLIQQPESAVAEILDKEFWRLNEDDRSKLNDFGKSQADRKEIIAESILSNSSSRVAVVDYLTAVGIESDFEQLPEQDFFTVYYLDYPVPLPVGFFVPIGDELFLEHLWNAVCSSYFDPKEPSWNEDFHASMERSLIEVDSVPSAIIYNTETDSWEPAYQDLLETLTETLVRTKEAEIQHKEKTKQEKEDDILNKEILEI